MKWEKVKLGELYEVHNGLSKAGKFFGEGYPFLTFSTVFNNYFIPKQITDLVQSTEKEQESYSIRRGDVFVTRTSETSDELGMSCVALKDYPMATYNGFTKRMRPITNRVLPEYIGYYMRLPNFRGEFRAFSTMTTRASLRNEDLLGLEVKLPSIEIQKQIADILSAYDDLIENNQKQIKLLEEATQRLYKEWFVDLRFPGHENTKIVDGVPEGWSRTNINEILTFHRGYDLTKNEMKAGRYPVVGSTTVIGYHNEFKIKGPGIVTGRSGSLGKYQFIWDNFWPHNTSLYISDYKDHNIFFVYSLLQTVDFASLNNGGAIPTLNRNVLSNIEVIEPTDELQEMFAKIAEAQYRKIRNLEKQNNQLKMARDVLLPKLMSGEVEV
jgi:type I restriction enzyme S subunit